MTFVSSLRKILTELANSNIAYGDYWSVIREIIIRSITMVFFASFTAEALAVFGFLNLSPNNPAYSDVKVFGLLVFACLFYSSAITVIRRVWH